ncbi:MAG: FAD-dependent oxidoreductase [Clostridiales bacterium]|nr:FAD-dependent oxidoreductase [Clostridiales bacterium]
MKFKKELGFDIAVAGGGVAGAAAAVQAARAGMKVVLIEKATQLGGLATIGLINYFVPMCNGRGVQIIKGMADEFLRLSMKYGFDTLPDEWKNGEPGFGNSTVRLVSRYSAPIFSLALLELLSDLGVTVMFDTVVTGTNAQDGHIFDIQVYNKSGFSKISAKVFIDATGDSDLLYQAGVPTVTGGNYHTYIAFGATIDSCKRVVETGDIGKLNHGFSGGNSTLYGKGHPDGMPLWDGTDGEQVSEYLIQNQIEMLSKIKDSDRRSRDITLLPIMPQFRTTRHIDGDYTLKEEDAYRHFEDSVCAICDFDRRDYLFEVPYRTMINSGFDNILAVGRCASAMGYAWDVLRVIPPAILTGQASGAAAAQAIKAGQSILDIDIKLLQNKLESENVMIHFSDEWIPTAEKKDAKYESDHI